MNTHKQGSVLVLLRTGVSLALLAFLALLALSPGCAGPTPYVYRPEQASVLVDGFPGARHAVPPEQPQGEVRVASFGVTDVTTAPGTAPLPALHLRMVVSNHGDATPWQIDTRAQELFVPGEGRSTPLYVNSDVQGLPLVSVPARERRVIDLYFPLPATVSEADHLARFDLLWQVQTGARLVSERTLFERQATDGGQAYAHTTVIVGWGPWWWYDPLPPRLVFVHPRVIVVHDHSRPTRVQVTRPQRVYVGRPGRKGR